MAPSGSQPPLREYVSAFIPSAMRSALEASAAAHDRSLSGELRHALRAYLSEPPPSLPSADEEPTS
jgi:hypothetical protein